MRFLKIGGVIVGALIVTALGIDATDSLRGSGGTMLGQLIGTASGVCPLGMVEVPGALSFTCVDAYEASPAANCPVAVVSNALDTEQNIAADGCVSVSTEGAVPWRYVAREQARMVCARSGKRLPTAEEWYQFAIDTNSDTCLVSGGAVGKSGGRSQCRTTHGVYDAVGNVWEWVGDDVADGTLNGRTLPPSGYVVEVDASGVASATDLEQPSALYGDDYFWSQGGGVYGMIRGGFYGGDEDAGVYAVHAYTQPSFVGEAIGFRCVR